MTVEACHNFCQKTTGCNTFVFQASTGTCYGTDGLCSYESSSGWNVYTKNGYAQPSVAADTCTHNSAFNSDAAQQATCAGRNQAACHVDTECRTLNTNNDGCSG
jgi:hypothetical protein